MGDGTEGALQKQQWDLPRTGCPPTERPVEKEPREEEQPAGESQPQPEDRGSAGVRERPQGDRVGSGT